MAGAHPPRPKAAGATRTLLLALWLLLGGCGSPPGSSTPQVLNRPNLLEDQEAMPELGGFDAQTPSSAPGLGAPLGTPSDPPLGQAPLLGQ